MITVDGSRGEGGGQIARVTLALAAAMGTPVRVTNVRAGRDSPGLKAQHATVARALAELSGGEVDGAEVGATEVTLRPGPLVGGTFEFQMPTAGSIPLLLQGILPAVIASGQPFELRCTGGTDVPFAPTWDYFTRVHFPLLGRMGVDVEAEATRRGFFPQGGGQTVVRVHGAALKRMDFTRTRSGPAPRVEGWVIAHALPKHVLERATGAARDAIMEAGFAGAAFEFEQHRGPGRGMCLTAIAGDLGACAVGKRGVSAEDIGLSVAAELVADLRAGAPVDARQLDQLLPYVALAGGGELRARKLTGHARTLIDILPELLPVRVDTTQEDALTRVRVTRV